MTDFRLIELGRKLRRKRAAVGISLKKMADKAKTSYQTLQTWETDPPRNPKKDVLKNIANAYGFQPEDLQVRENVDEYGDPAFREKLQVFSRLLRSNDPAVENLQDKAYGLIARAEKVFLEMDGDKGHDDKNKT